MRKSLQLYTMETRESICTRGCTSLTNGTIYFGTGQYRCTVLDLPLFYIYIYIYACVCVYYNKYKSLL